MRRRRAARSSNCQPEDLPWWTATVSRSNRCSWPSWQTVVLSCLKPRIDLRSIVDADIGGETNGFREPFRAISAPAPSRNAIDAIALLKLLGPDVSDVLILAHDRTVLPARAIGRGDPRYAIQVLNLPATELEVAPARSSDCWTVRAQTGLPFGSKTLRFLGLGGCAILCSQSETDFRSVQICAVAIILKTLEKICPLCCSVQTRCNLCRPARS